MRTLRDIREDLELDYSPLFETLKERGETGYSLVNKRGFSQGTYHRIRRGLVVHSTALAQLCYLLDCELNEVAKLKQPNNKSE